MAFYRACVVEIGTALEAACGLYMPAPADAYDSGHAFLYFYGNFRFGSVIQLLPTATREVLPSIMNPLSPIMR